MALHQSPSARLRLERNPWLAYQFDTAVLTFGRHVESELERVKGRSDKTTRIKRKMKLHEMLGLPRYMPALDVHSMTTVE